MKHCVPLGLILILACTMMSCTISKRLANLDVAAEEARPMPHIDIAEYEAKYGDHDGVLLNYDIMVDHSGSKENGYYGIGGSWNYVRVYKRTFIVFNPDNPNLTTLDFSFKPEKMYVRVMAPDGLVKIYDEALLHEDIDSDGYKEYKLAIPDVGKGSIVDVGYEFAHSAGRGVLPLEFYLPLQFTLPCEKLKVTYAYPRWWTIDVRDLADDRKLQYEVSHDEAMRKSILTCTRRDVPARVDEEFSPYFKEYGEYLQLQVASCAIKGWIVTGLSNWTNYASGVRKAMLKKASKNQDLIKETADRIVQGDTTRLGRFENILKFVNDSLTIAGEGYDGDFAKVLKAKEGNLFDITGLAQALMDAVYLNTDIYLVHSPRDGNFDHEYFDPEQLSTPAIMIIEDGKKYVAFPYMEDLPYNVMPDIFQGQIALSISQDTEGIFEYLPKPGIDNNTTEFNYEVTIDENGSTHIMENDLLQGFSGYVMRESLRHKDSVEIRDFVTGIMNEAGSEFLPTTVAVNNLDRFEEPCMMELHYAFDNLAIMTPDEVIMRTNGLFTPWVLGEDRIMPGERMTPIRIYGDRLYKKTIHITWPEGWILSDVPPDVEFTNDIGGVAAHWEVEGNGAMIRQAIKLKECFLPKERIGDLVDLIGNNTRLNIDKLVFSLPAEEQAQVNPNGRD